MRRKLFTFLFTLLGILFLENQITGAGTCPVCEKLKERNLSNSTQFEYYEDYLRSTGGRGEDPKRVLQEATLQVQEDTIPENFHWTGSR